ncbi:MAG: DEAD/DEAH box helicase [Gammaproteobacteria bacterium]|nr:DEAD/DEAH box helicase [Gammaproteobacteria bacterium]
MYSPQQSAYFAHWLSLRGNYEESLTQTIAGAKVDMNPHQVQAALFALRSPLSKGVILADEVGLGKTIEASLVLAQRWAEQKRNLLLIVPATLRKQWAQELQDKFDLPVIILESSNFNAARKDAVDNPFKVKTWDREAIVLASYEFAARKKEELSHIPWDLVVFDEAHKLRNIYKADGAKTAKALNESLLGCPKILMTATPLQNSLLELYGMVSVIDPYFFGSLDAFKARYPSQNIDSNELRSLGKRLSKIVNRSLREQVQKTGSFNFTRRYSLTEDFTPSELEHELYQQVSDYLCKDDLVAIKPEARHLVTLVIRKILASSTYAIAGTLDNMIRRLESDQSVLADLAYDYETIDDFDDQSENDQPTNPHSQNLANEIALLSEFRNLAQTIPTNAKAEALLRVLNRAFEMTERLGGARKAVVFTESVRTQTMLYQLLSAEGYKDQIVLLNGSNKDLDSRNTYKEWAEKHRDSARVSGSKTSDMKAALVDKFRDDATLMISTEAGAEGINLQFCSLLINYDLPWNPQRVEQRIGRVHRYGQKHDVVVVNFINRGNRADERVFELLNEKFELFEGVFGASDEILGSIESGVDIERRIFDVYQKCRTDTEIDAAFNELKAEKAPILDAQMRETARSVLNYFDTNVVQKLNGIKDTTARQLGLYQQRMMYLAKAELSSSADFFEDRFSYKNQWYDLNWPAAQTNDGQFFRPHEGLGEKLIHTAKEREIDEQVLLELNYGTPRTHMADVRNLIGQQGEMRVEKYVIKSTKQTLEYLIVSACLDSGDRIEEETAKRLLLVPGQSQPNEQALKHNSTLQQQIAQQQDDKFSLAEDANEKHFEEETEKLENWSDDRKIALEIRMKKLDREVADARRHARQLPSLKEKVAAKQDQKKLERERDKVMLNYHEEKKNIENKEDELLEEAAAALEMTTLSICLFSVSWRLGGES